MNDTDMNRTIRTGDARRQEAGHDARQQARREARKKKILDHSLFLYVVDHLNSRGSYRGLSLPDAPYRPYSGGQEDVMLTNVLVQQDDVQQASRIYLLLRSWMQHPEARTERELYRLVATSPMALFFQPLASLLRREKLPYTLLDLAQEWLYTASDREVLKFVYLLCGLIGLRQIRTVFSRNFYDDLFTLARCEEFTLYLCLACRLSDEAPQEDLWKVARHTSQWGRVLVTSLLEYDTPRKKEWLFRHSDNADSVLWLDEQGFLIEQCGLLQILSRPSLNEADYAKAGNLVLGYITSLLPRQGVPAEMMPSAPSPDVIKPPAVHVPLEPLLTQLLRHARTHCRHPEDLTFLNMLRMALESLSEQGTWSELSPNRCEEFMAQCDALLYAKDRKAEILQALHTRKRLPEKLLNLAQDLNIDIWDEVMAYVKTHPQNMAGLHYLIYGITGPDLERRSSLFLDFFQRHLKPYMRQKELCFHLNAFLATAFGKGIPILAAFLTATDSGQRSGAAIVLRHWPPRCLDAELQQALRQALALPNDPETREMLQTLLSGKYEPFPLPDDEPFEEDAGEDGPDDEPGEEAAGEDGGSPILH